MKKYKVFFDTNSVKNGGGEAYFHNIDILKSLKSLEQDVEILLPDIVLKEIEVQKRRDHKIGIDRLKQNGIYKQLSCETKKIIDNDIPKIEEKIEYLKKDIGFEFTCVELKNKNILDEIMELAIAGEPPFEERTDNNDNKSDKGIKDAYIFFTIKQYSDTIDNNTEVIACTKDGRLRLALENIGVTVCKINEVKNNIINPYQTEAFIEKLQLKLNDIFNEESFTANKKDINYLYSNSYYNDIIEMQVDDNKILFEIENNNIINYIFEHEKNLYVKERLNKPEKGENYEYYNEKNPNIISIRLKVEQRKAERFLSSEDIFILNKASMDALRESLEGMYNPINDLNDILLESVKQPLKALNDILLENTRKVLMQCNEHIKPLSAPDKQCLNQKLKTKKKAKS